MKVDENFWIGVVVGAGGLLIAKSIYDLYQQNQMLEMGNNLMALGTVGLLSNMSPIQSSPNNIYLGAL